MKQASRFIALGTILLLVTAVAGPDAKLTERQRALHALNRLGFGPRPGQVDKVLETGLDTWIEQQLHPDRIPDRAVDARLQQYPTLQMSDQQIWDRYYVPVQQARQEARRAAREGKEMDQADLVKTMRAKVPPDQRPQHVVQELQAQRIIRAAESERQLNEVMVDFWINHFNVFAGKGIDSVMLTGYERDAIRPHIWGRFEDLLMATAKSPAMLFYLDNARSVADPANRPQNLQARAGGRAIRPAGRRFLFARRSAPANRSAMPQAKQPKGGLNENYAREIMELHTLGVDGGYSQKDVTELARVFTGWTIAPPKMGGGFVFRPRLHDVGAKTVLGIHFPAGGGIEEGEKMIHVLAHHPATAHHIAWQLCQRLVADDPPKALVDRVAKRFLDSDGDLRETVKAVITSPEFWDPQYYRAKVKSPFEYAVSAVRAVDGEITDPMPLARQLGQIGEPLYGAQPPTGYSDKAEAWVNTGALLSRLNFALALASNKMPGVHADVVSLIPAPEASDAKKAVDSLARALTGGDLTPETENTIEARIVERKAPTEDPWDNTQLPTIAGLILGSPEFQRQ